MTKKTFIIAGIALVLVTALWLFKKPPSGITDIANLKTSFSVKLPEFSGQQKRGQQKFIVNCMVCHGKHATGTGKGPPLIHKYYEPNHHGDAAFYRAAQNGVRSHHWRFGNMPPVSTASKSDVTDIISYIRAIQRANGIY